MVNINNITFRYSRKKAPVLENFSLHLGNGNVCGLLGKNGAGKSTLLYVIAGLLTPNSGSVTFNGENTRNRLPQSLNDMFLVPEEFDLPKVTLSDYISLNASFYPRFDISDMRRYLQMFEMNENVNLGQLSMGQKKKVYICFALATNVSLLLMDEPTNGLDIPGKSQFRKVIASGMTGNRCIVISTHQVRDIDRLLDHIIIIDNNRVLLDADTNSITDRLAFANTSDQTIISEALYAQPSLDGVSVILPNQHGIDSEINIETLFSLASEKPETVTQIFNTNNTVL